MNIEELSAELEEDLLWRREELAVLKNQAINEAKPERRRAFLRALVVMLYAHFEGYCRQALTLYANVINAQGLKCSEVQFSIAATAVAPHLRSLFNTDSPKGPRLDFARAVKFVSDLDKLQSDALRLKVDDVVNTGANLMPDVLSRILMRLGFRSDLLSHHDVPIRNLLSRRNPVAHGDRIDGVSNEEQYETLEKNVFLIMAELTSAIQVAAAGGHYLKGTSPAS